MGAGYAERPQGRRVPELTHPACQARVRNDRYVASALVVDSGQACIPDVAPGVHPQLSLTFAGYVDSKLLHLLCIALAFRHLELEAQGAVVQIDPGIFSGIISNLDIHISLFKRF